MNEAPTIYLSHVPGAQGDNSMMGKKGVEAIPRSSAPAVLISFYYLKKFLENQERYVYRTWALDSGAFSAFNSGVEIDLQQYIDTCLHLMETDPTLVEIFALDVIGDAEATLRNTEEMIRQGVPVIPTYHYGNPEEQLIHIAKTYPKIALGGVAKMRGGKKKNDWAAQCFARVWPKKIHGFGFGSEKSIMALPWHSVDATNWEMMPCAFGNWKAFEGQRRMSVRGSRQNLRAEIEWYLDLEKRAQGRWVKEMKKLETDGPTVRLALIGSGREEGNLTRRKP